MRFSARPLSKAVRARVVGSSWREGCPVPIADLRYLRVPYVGFDGKRHLGELIVHEDAVDAMKQAFAALLAHGHPIRRMRLVDDYGADDFASIERDNTSAFNCRPVTGGTGWSEHSYGRAIDVNPIENPYVFANGTTVHDASEPFLDRSIRRPGMAISGGPYVEEFKAVGWKWGGDWSSPQDLQHFSATGR